MKKILAAALSAFMLITVFTACDSLKPEEIIKNFISDKINESLEDSDDESKSSKADSQEKSESSKAEKQESKSSEKPAADEKSSGGNNLGLPANLLTNSFINTVMGGKYYINYTGIISAEGQKFDAEFFTAVDGETIGSKTIMQMGDIKVTTRILKKGDEAYMINDDTKSYTVLTSDDNPMENNFDYDNIEYVKSGTETLDGKSLKYEEFKVDEGTTRYYYDGSKLYAIVVKSLDNEFKMIIKEVSNKIPAGLLDLPSSYKKGEIPSIGGMQLPDDVGKLMDNVNIDDLMKKVQQ